MFPSTNPDDPREQLTARSLPTLREGGQYVPGERPGDEIGPYALVELIGEGGFGVVWHARRLRPFLQDVALKVIKPGMDSQAVIARFEHERQALAMMDHPGLAKMMDGGLTPSGRPYFVMELVRGEPITAFCDRERLDFRARVALFVAVCEAVQHAHMKGIIHRDLKPSNILAASVDARAIVKVIDFGIAKAIGSGAEAGVTVGGQAIGTPEYMSPEQAGGALDVDTRTDLYALGAVLYELLTGELPLDSNRLRGAGYEAMLRVIREEEPPRPVERLRTPQSLAAAAAARSVRPEVYLRALGSDLAWVPLRALRKSRDERYATAQEIADDLRRYLAEQPLRARPPTMKYHLRKFARRHRWGLGAAGAVTLALVLGLAALVVGLTRARQGRDSAERSAEFLLGVIAGLNPLEAPEQNWKDLTPLDHAASRLEAGVLAREPLMEAKVRGALARGYYAAGRVKDAEKHLLGQLKIMRSVGVPAEVASVLNQLAEVRRVDERDEEALAALEESEVIQGVGPDAQVLSATLRMRAAILLARGENETAVKTLNTAAAALRGPGDAESVAMGLTQLQLGPALLAVGSAEAAEAACRRGLALTESAPDASQAVIADACNTLGAVLDARGEWDEAAAFYRRALTITEQRRPSGHPELDLLLNNLAAALIKAGRFEEGAETALRALPGERGRGRTASLLGVLTLAGIAELEQGRAAAALPRFEEAMEIAMEVGEAGSAQGATVQMQLAHALSRVGRDRDALAPARRALELRAALWGEDHPLTAIARSVLATALDATGDGEKADEVLLAAYKAVEAAPGIPEWRRRGVARCLATVYKRRGDTANAAYWAEVAGGRAGAEPLTEGKP